jgi:hypothetical protein
MPTLCLLKSDNSKKLKYIFLSLVTVITLFFYQPYSLFDQNRKKEHNIIDLRHYFGNENGDAFNI